MTRNRFPSKEICDQIRLRHPRGVLMLYCQDYYTTIQDCCNLRCLDILHLNLNSQLIYIMLFLNMLNALTALPRHNTLVFSIIVIPLSFCN